MKIKKYILIFSIAVFLTLFYLLISSKYNSSTSLNPSSASSEDGKNFNAPTQVTDSQKSTSLNKLPDFGTAEKEYLESLKKNDSHLTQETGDKLMDNSNKVLKTFKDKAKLEFAPPSAMYFAKLDMDDPDLEGTYGLSVDGKSGLAVIATYRSPKEEVVRSFLVESKDEFPNLKNKTVSWEEKPTSYEAPATSGIKEAKVWTGTDANGDSYAAVLLPRSDNKGTYFFVYNSRGKAMFENDDYFGKVFSEIKATPF